MAGRPHAGDSGSDFFPKPNDHGNPATGTFVEPDAIAVDVAKNTFTPVGGAEVRDPVDLSVTPEGKVLVVAAGGMGKVVYSLDPVTARLTPLTGGKCPSATAATRWRRVCRPSPGWPPDRTAPCTSPTSSTTGCARSGGNRLTDDWELSDT
ncbi:hypothetical protein [Amycolatopsis speibonae]|uniref:Uncharacterized protein n=1 Tax=Amycolatopsis speibonae TaxID=1450224 RepID=A0ABV7P323_9PSEU